MVPEIRQSLKPYIPIARMIAKTFGKNCEVVIHDMLLPTSSVVFVVNSHVTGREVGQPFDHLIRQVLLSDDFDGDYAANYLIETEDGRKINSSTVLIKDETEKLIGALCINYDIHQLENVMDFITDMMSIKRETPSQEKETIKNVTEIVDDLIHRIISTVDIDNVKAAEKKALIEFMDAKGVFLIKGAIDKVAAEMKMSKVSIYSYLDKIRKNK